MWVKKFFVGLLLLTTFCVPSAATTLSGELKTDKSVYSLGETVTIIFTNTGAFQITLRNSGPWVIKDKNGAIVFHPIALMVITHVQPGQTMNWTWDQKDDNGMQVSEGPYTVELETGAGTYTATFQIQKSTVATLTVQASDFRNPITGVPIKVWPPDLNHQSDGYTPFARQYHIGDRVTLEAPLPDPSSCLWRGAPFHNWQIEKDAEYLQGTGGCYGRATMEIEITGPNPTVTALFEGTPGPEFCAQLSTDKQVYSPGEEVTIIFTNNCTYTINLNCDRPWRIKDNSGKIVFAPEVVLWVVVSVDPGETITWTWDQKDKYNKQVPEGLYTAELDTMDAGTYSVPMIEEHIGPGKTKTWSWGQKNRYNKQVPDDTYTIELETMNAGIYTASFEVKTKRGPCLGTILVALLVLLGAAGMYRRR